MFHVEQLEEIILKPAKDGQYCSTWNNELSKDNVLLEDPFLNVPRGTLCVDRFLYFGKGYGPGIKYWPSRVYSGYVCFSVIVPRGTIWSPLRRHLYLMLEFPKSHFV